MFPHNFFIRNLDADDLQDNFLVSAVATILSIRFFLYITHYPQISLEGLHIAHLFWGGLFMLVGFIIFLTFISKSAAVTASIIGGIGFGAFIDELGKFITSDNNYFFQPTVALIYSIFVLLYLLLRTIPKYRRITKREYLINALEMVKEAVISDLDIEEKKQAQEYLSHADAKDPIVKAIKKLLADINTIKPPPPTVFTKIRTYIRQWYFRFAESHIIGRGIVAILFVQSMTTVVLTAVVLFHRPELTFHEWGRLMTSIASAIFVIIGFYYLRTSKKIAYQHFKMGILISIFLTQFFEFYTAQFNAIFTLAFNILMLFVINYILALETKKDSSD